MSWCIEALTFLICGLQTRAIVSQPRPPRAGPTLFDWRGSSSALTVIVVRFLWVFPVTYLPRWLWPPLRRREPAPNWRPPFLDRFCTGLRGAVSLAAALSIPLNLAGGEPFPHRDLILFSTICVILPRRWSGQGAALLGPLTSNGSISPASPKRESVRQHAGRNGCARKTALDAVLARLDALESRSHARAASLPSGALQESFTANAAPEISRRARSRHHARSRSTSCAIRLDLIAARAVNAIGDAYEKQPDHRRKPAPAGARL